MEEINKKVRSSNLELFRIICMLAIVAHHYVVNSGLLWSFPDSPMSLNPMHPNSLYLLFFGMWGKTGINCFMLITGYFMCTSKITLKKFVKLLCEIYFYNIVIFLIFFGFGRETMSAHRLFDVVFPFSNLSYDFVPCFLVFFLTIPFWNILISNMTKKQHLLITSLLVFVYSIFGSVPGFNVGSNYVIWFGVLYLIASFFRLYPIEKLEKRWIWGAMTVLSIVVAVGSVVLAGPIMTKWPYFLVHDSNKILALVVAVSAFNWFRLLKMPQSKTINFIASSTFAVLLIHSNSDAMRQFLWVDMFDSVGSFSYSLPHLIGYSLGAVAIIFVACVLIDKIRIYLLEKPVFSSIFRG